MAASVAITEGLLDLGVGVSGFVPLVLGSEVGVDLLQVFGAEVDLAVDRLNLLVSEVRYVGRGELGSDGDLQGLESLVLVGESLVESESPDARLADSLVITELLLVFLNRGNFSSVVDPLNITSNLLKDFVAFGRFHKGLKVSVFVKFGLHFIGIGLELVSDTFPVKELAVRCVELQLLFTKGFLLLGRDGVGRGVELDGSVSGASALFGLVLLLSGSTILISGRSNGNLLVFSPSLSKFSSLKLGNLVEVVLDLDHEFSLALSVLLLEGSLSDVVASQLCGETLHELGEVVGVLVVVE